MLVSTAARAFPLAEARGAALLLLVRRLLTGAASLAMCGLSSAAPGSRAQAGHLWHTSSVAPWHMGSPGSRTEPPSPILAGGFLATEPPGKPTKKSTVGLTEIPLYIKRCFFVLFRFPSCF